MSELLKSLSKLAPAIGLKLGGVIGTLGITIGLAWLVSWGLRHGFHFDTGYLGLAFAGYFGLGALKAAVHNLAKSAAAGQFAGRSEAQEQQIRAKVAQMAGSPEGKAMLDRLMGNITGDPATDLKAAAGAGIVGQYI